MLANAGRQRVGAIAQQGHDVTGTDRDDVATAQVDGQSVGDADAGLAQGGGLGVVVALGVHLHHAVVAQDGLSAGTANDGVRAHAAQDGVVAIAQGDAVVAAGGGQGVGGAVAQRLASAGLSECDVDHFAVVAQHGVLANAGVDDVSTITTQHDLCAVQRGDRVCATQIGRAATGRGLRLGRDAGELDPCGIHFDDAVVAHHRVGPVLQADGVATHAAKNGVVAVARDDDAVGCARATHRGGVHIQRVGGLKLERISPTASNAGAQRHVGDDAVVAKDSVAARSQGDRI